jgi:transcriptional regulator with XRE-family HTH domain
MTALAVTPISIRLEELRRAKGWSQAKLSRESGVPQGTISKLESGATGSIAFANLEKLAKALGVHPAVLIDYTPESEPPQRGRGK